MKQHNMFFIFLSLAILIRVMLLVWSLPLNINGDQWRYEDWGRVAHVYGFANTYTSQHVKTFVNNQPPGSLYIISATYESYILVSKIIVKITHTSPGSLQWVNTILLHLFMRLPSLMTDIGMGIFAYLIVRSAKEKHHELLAASLIWFNPVIFYNSSVWGQMDSLNNFFFLFGVFFAFRKNYIWSLLAVAFSLYIKLSLLPLVPFYLIFLLYHSQKNVKILGIGILMCLSGIILATLPISREPILWLVTQLPFLARGELQNITNGAFNFWWATTCFPTQCSNIPTTQDTFLNISLEIWAYLLFAISCVPFVYIQLKKTKIFIQKEYIFLLFALVALLTFLFLPKMHDRYLYPVFPFMAIAIGMMKKTTIYIVLFCLLSFIHFQNLLYSFYPTYFPAFIFYQILYSDIFRWGVSISIVIVSGVVYVKSLKKFTRV